MLVYVGGCLSMWPRFKCDSRQHHVMASANTEHYCDLSVFLPTSLPQTHTYKHTHTFLTWECCLRLNQCHACHISCQRSSLSSDLSPPFLVSFLYPLSLPSLSFLCLFFSSFLLLLCPLPYFLLPYLCTFLFHLSAITFLPLFLQQVFKQSSVV